MRGEEERRAATPSQETLPSPARPGELISPLHPSTPVLYSGFSNNFHIKWLNKMSSEIGRCSQIKVYRTQLLFDLKIFAFDTQPVGIHVSVMHFV